MKKLNEYFNKVSNDNRIFTREDISKMTTNEFKANEKAIDYQLSNLGIPKNSDMAQSDDVVYVRSYVKNDGTRVKAHYRSKRESVIEFANNLDNMTSGEKTIDTLGRIASVFLTVAGENLQNARRNFEYAKKNANAHIVSRSNINNKGLNELMNKIGIPKNSRGVIYDINSVQSKKLFNSPEIQGYISKNYPELINNKQNSVVDINFTLKQKFKGTDNFLGLQHCKLYNPQITSDGHFIGTIVDYYDFKYRPLAGSIKEIVLNYVNNWGYFMQEKSFLENQFNIYQIREKLW